MNEEMNNVIEVEETGVDNYYNAEESNESSEGGNGLALVLGGLAAIGAAGALIYKKVKAKKEAKAEDKPKKKTKKKLMWVEVEEEPASDPENFEDEFVDDEKTDK